MTGLLPDCAGVPDHPLCQNLDDPFEWLPAWRWHDVMELWAGSVDKDGNFLQQVWWTLSKPLAGVIDAVFAWVTDGMFWAAGLMWGITLAALRIALHDSADYAEAFMVEMENISRHLTDTLIESPGGMSLFGAVGVIGVLAGVWTMWRKGGKAGLRTLFGSLIPLGILMGMSWQMAEASRNAEYYQYVKGEPPPDVVGTPRWLFNTSTRLADTVSIELTNLIGSLSQKPREHITYCDAYTAALEDLFRESYVNAAGGDPARAKARAELPIKVSQLWQQTGHAAWGAAQFGGHEMSQKSCLTSEARSSHVKAIETQAVWDATCAYTSNDDEYPREPLYGCAQNRDYHNQAAWNQAQGRWKSNPNDVDSERTRMILGLACEFTDHEHARRNKRRSPVAAAYNRISTGGLTLRSTDPDLVVAAKTSDGRWVWVDRRWVGVAGNKDGTNLISAEHCANWIAGVNQKAGSGSISNPPSAPEPVECLYGGRQNGAGWDAGCGWIMSWAQISAEAKYRERFAVCKTQESRSGVSVWAVAPTAQEGGCWAPDETVTYTFDQHGGPATLTAGVVYTPHIGAVTAQVPSFCAEVGQVFIQYAAPGGANLYMLPDDPDEYVEVAENCFGGFEMVSHVAGATTTRDAWGDDRSDHWLGYLGDTSGGVTAGVVPTTVNPGVFIENVYQDELGVSEDCSDTGVSCLQNAADVTPDEIQQLPGRMIGFLAAAAGNGELDDMPDGEQVALVVETVHDLHGASKFDRLFKGLFAVLTAFSFMVALIGLSVGLILAQLILVVVFTCLPLLLIVFAVPSAAARRLPRKIFKVTVGALLSSVVFLTFLTLTILIVYLLATVVDSVDVARANDYVHLVILMAVPYGALKLVGMLGKQFGMDITSLKGAVSATSGLAFANMSTPQPSGVYSAERQMLRRGMNRYRALDRAASARAATGAGLAAAAGSGAGAAAGGAAAGGSGAGLAAAAGAGAGAAAGGGAEGMRLGSKSLPKEGLTGFGEPGSGGLGRLGGAVKGAAKGARYHKKKLIAAGILAAGVPAATAVPALLLAKAAGMATRRWTQPMGLTRTKKQIAEERAAAAGNTRRVLASAARGVGGAATAAAYSLRPPAGFGEKARGFDGVSGGGVGDLLADPTAWTLPPEPEPPPQPEDTKPEASEAEASEAAPASGPPPPVVAPLSSEAEHARHAREIADAVKQARVGIDRSRSSRADAEPVRQPRETPDAVQQIRETPDAVQQIRETPDRSRDRFRETVDHNRADIQKILDRHRANRPDPKTGR